MKAGDMFVTGPNARLDDGTQKAFGRAVRRKYQILELFPDLFAETLRIQIGKLPPSSQARFQNLRRNCVQRFTAASRLRYAAYTYGFNVPFFSLGVSFRDLSCTRHVGPQECRYKTLKRRTC